MHDLEREVARRGAAGNSPKTVKEINAVLSGIGYCLDRSLDCRHVTRYMTGPHMGESYPATSTGIRHIKTGLGFANINAPRDENFRRLQEYRRAESLYAIVRGAILDL